MEQRATIPVLPPQPSPTTSYWQSPPDPILANYQSTNDGTLPEYTDTIIIGSGITGSRIAYNLLSQPTPPPSVLLLEARGACSGATGRNGGHTKAGSYFAFPEHIQKYGVEMAVKIARFEYHTIQSLHAFARSNSINCDLYSGDTIDVFYDKGVWEAAQKAVQQLRDAMPSDLDDVAKYEVWNAEEARERFKVHGEGICGAISYFAGSLSAYAFVCGVLHLALSKGLQLYTHTPVISLSQPTKDGLWEVRTEKVVVRAKRVVLATNGYTGAIWKGFQSKIVPLRGQITAQRPGSMLPAGTLKETYSFIYKGGYEYMIHKLPNANLQFPGDIVIGGGLTKSGGLGESEFGIVDDTFLNPRISHYLRECTVAFFGDAWGEDDAKGRVRREWSGIMGFTGDGLPFVGQVPGESGLWIAAAFQGHGMVTAWRCAEALVGMMGGEEREWFPEVFKITEERMGVPFTGIGH